MVELTSLGRLCSHVVLNHRSIWTFRRTLNLERHFHSKTALVSILDTCKDRTLSLRFPLKDSSDCCVNRGLLGSLISRPSGRCQDFWSLGEIIGTKFMCTDKKCT